MKQDCCNAVFAVSLPSLVDSRGLRTCANTNRWFCITAPAKNVCPSQSAQDLGSYVYGAMQNYSSMYAYCVVAPNIRERFRSGPTNHVQWPVNLIVCTYNWCLVFDMRPRISERSQRGHACLFDGWLVGLLVSQLCKA